MSCAIPGCERRVTVAGHCNMHYKRVRQGRDIHAPYNQKPSTPIEERFWPRVQKSDDGCWVWQGHVDRFGYGLIGRGRSCAKTHRVSWELSRGPIPAGLHVLHRCDNPPCVRPDHLFLGTNAENNADMMAKGRYRGGIAWPGEQNPFAKLTESQVRAILLSPESAPAWALRLGVSESAVRLIRQGKRWKHITAAGRAGSTLPSLPNQGAA